MQPDSEAEADKGAQSEQQDEMVAKDDDLDHESGEKGLLTGFFLNAMASAS